MLIGPNFVRAFRYASFGALRSSLALHQLTFPNLTRYIRVRDDKYKTRSVLETKTSMMRAFTGKVMQSGH